MKYVGRLKTKSLEKYKIKHGTVKPEDVNRAKELLRDIYYMMLLANKKKITFVLEKNKDREIKLIVKANLKHGYCRFEFSDYYRVEGNLWEARRYINENTNIYIASPPNPTEAFVFSLEPHNYLDILEEGRELVKQKLGFSENWTADLINKTEVYNAMVRA